MTSIREVINRLMDRGKPEPDLPDPAFDYRVYWTKQAMGWSPEQRERIHAQVSSLMNQPEFSVGETQRIYRLQALDDSSFAGASIVELDAVLRALQDK
jgi:hypothetical protein